MSTIALWHLTRIVYRNNARHNTHNEPLALAWAWALCFQEQFIIEQRTRWLESHNTTWKQAYAYVRLKDLNSLFFACLLARTELHKHKTWHKIKETITITIHNAIMLFEEYSTRRPSQSRIVLFCAVPYCSHNQWTSQASSSSKQQTTQRFATKLCYAEDSEN